MVCAHPLPHFYDVPVVEHAGGGDPAGAQVEQADPVTRFAFAADNGVVAVPGAAHVLLGGLVLGEQSDQLRIGERQDAELLGGGALAAEYVGDRDLAERLLVAPGEVPGLLAYVVSGPGGAAVGKGIMVLPQRPMSGVVRSRLIAWFDDVMDGPSAVERRGRCRKPARS